MFNMPGKGGVGKSFVTNSLSQYTQFGRSSGFSDIELDGIDGWRLHYDGHSPIKVLVPSDYYEKGFISRDDITNLRIELNTLKTVEAFEKSSVLFAQDFRPVYFGDY